MITANSPFFDCTFLFNADDVAGDEPYVLFEDDQADPFLRDLTAAVRGPAAAVHRSIEALASTTAPVVMAAPVWHRNHQRLVEAGVRGPRAKVLLYFDTDPSGYWDFAKGCQGSLGRLFRSRALDDQAMRDLSPFFEEWLAGRPFAGRMTSFVGQANREFKTLLQREGAAISRVFANFSDDLSRSIYARILYGTPMDIFNGFVKVAFGEQQYMEIVDFTPGEFLVNCGVGRGWELPYFITKMQGEGTIYNFDCNSTYDSSPYAAMLKDFSGMIQDHNVLLGVHDGEIDLPVSQGNMVRSSDQAMQGSAAKQTFPIRTIDSLAREGVIQGADYIKMDVEGGEKYILEGGLQTIKKLRPKLAVAIYHEPNHFWEYPSFLMDNLQDYNYYLRQYGYSRFETLLYAIPKEREARLESTGRTARSSRAVSQGLLSFYLFDKAPRNYFAGPKKVLTRVEGASWPRADLDCGPRIDADRMICVWEDDERRLYATRHRFDDGQTRLSIGRSTDDPQVIEWRVTANCSAETAILPIWNTRASVGVAICEPDGPVSLSFWDGEGSEEVKWRTILDIKRPLLVMARAGEDAGYQAMLPGETPDTLRFIQFAPDGSQVEEEVYELPMRGFVLGVVRIKQYVQGNPYFAPAFLVGNEGAGFAEVLVIREGRLKSIGSIDIDPASMIVPVVALDPEFKA